MVSTRKLLGLLPFCFGITEAFNQGHVAEAYRHGDVITQNGDSYKWFTAGHDMLRAFSLTGIVQEEYDGYKDAMDRELPGQALSLAEFKKEGVFILDPESARQVRLQIEANHTRALESVKRESSVSDVGSPNLEERDICEIGANCVSAAAGFCVFKFFPMMNYVKNHLSKKETWISLTKNPLVASVAGGAIGANAAFHYVSTTKAKGNTGDNPPKDCNEAKGQLYKIFQETINVCKTEQENIGKKKCISSCKTFLFNSLDVYDHLEHHVQLRGNKCPKNPKCDVACHT